MRVRDLQQILGKFTDGEKGTNISDCPIYLETKDGYLEEVRFIALEKNTLAFLSAITVLLRNSCSNFF